MRVADSDLDAIAVATTPCPRCEVTPGNPCVALSESGKPAQRADHPHEPRLLPVRAAYAVGWFDGNGGRSERPAEIMAVDLLDKIIVAGREA